MRKNFGRLAIAICAWSIVLAAQTVPVAQEPPERPAANPEIIRMLRAGLPESTILSEIEILAGRGSTFDISPAALTELKQSGATEKELNSVVWAQMELVPVVAVPHPRGIFYRASTGANMTPLGSFLFFDEIHARWATWPFYKPGGKDIAVNASPAVVQITEGSPTLYVQGFESDAGWQLVKISRGPDYRELHVKTKHAFSKDFFSDSVFPRSELRPLTVAPAGENYTIRPASPLEAGVYALCSQLPGGVGFMRACYEFQVTGI